MKIRIVKNLQWLVVIMIGMPILIIAWLFSETGKNNDQE